MIGKNKHCSDMISISEVAHDTDNMLKWRYRHVHFLSKPVLVGLKLGDKWHKIVIVTDWNYICNWVKGCKVSPKALINIPTLTSLKHHVYKIFFKVFFHKLIASDIS